MMIQHNLISSHTYMFLAGAARQTLFSTVVLIYVRVFVVSNKQNTTYVLNTKEKQKKTALASRTIYTLIWYAFYDVQPENGVGRILTAPHGRLTIWSLSVTPIECCHLKNNPNFCHLKKQMENLCTTFNRVSVHVVHTHKPHITWWQ